MTYSTVTRSLRAALALAAVLLAPPAWADNPSVNVQVFRPSAHGHDLISVMTNVITPDRVAFTAGLTAHYGRDALVYRDSEVDTLRDGVIEEQLTLDLMGSISFADRVSVGVAVPLFLLNRGQDGGFVPTEPVSSFALGDVRLSPKVAILPRSEPGFGLGLAIGLGLPTGDTTSFVSDGFTAEPAVLIDGQIGPVTLAANLGYRIREAVRLPLAEEVGNEVFFRAGAEVDVIPHTLSAVAELTGAFGDFDAANLSHLEGIVGARVRIDEPGIELTAAAGSGFLSGYGNTQYRLVFGAAWVPGAATTDGDGDGIEDEDDGCPDAPEDADGFEDSDGCPDPDNDGDGIADAADTCPNDPEDGDGFEDGDGCPDADNDADGIADSDDACPDEAEDVDSVADEDGCPEVDADQDGIADGDDQCPIEAEDRDRFQDEDGCPEPDNDGDGILDVEDACPSDAANACGITIDPCEIRISQAIYFHYDSDRIKARSFPTLASISEVLLSREALAKVEVQGHTDSEGDDRYNLELSHKRAAAVVAFLTDKGVSAGRLVAKGYGETEPIAKNMTRSGRAKNRRVQFIILDPTQASCSK